MYPRSDGRHTFPNFTSGSFRVQLGIISGTVQSRSFITKLNFHTKRKIPLINLFVLDRYQGPEVSLLGLTEYSLLGWPVVRVIGFLCSYDTSEFLAYSQMWTLSHCTTLSKISQELGVGVHAPSAPLSVGTSRVLHSYFIPCRGVRSNLLCFSSFQ